MSEGFGTVIGPNDYALGKRGSVGKPLILDDIRIIDSADREVPAGEIGEICGCSLGLMKGYYNNQEATRAALWTGPNGRSYIRSGDLGRFDEDGYLYVCGRIKDMIKSGGINVYPTDIEKEFAQHPAVQEVAVIGVPHLKWMETPIAFVIRRHGHEEVTSDQIMSWGNERLSKYQRVSAVIIADDFPRVTYGKVDKKKLGAPFWEHQERTN
jgi:acyl-CoA synthetase (AMP-forming)/AMP-acid ligase II